MINNSISNSTPSDFPKSPAQRYLNGMSGILSKDWVLCSLVGLLYLQLCFSFIGHAVLDWEEPQILAIIHYTTRYLFSKGVAFLAMLLLVLQPAFLAISSKANSDLCR